MTTIAEYAQESVIPKRTLTYLHRREIIQDPLQNDDLVRLQLLEQVWCDRELLRWQLRRFSLKARTSLIRTADLATKWERYAYSRFRNQEEGSILSMDRVVQEIETTFGFKLNKQHIRRLHRARNRAQVARHREAKSLESAGGNSFLQSTTKEKETAFIAPLPNEKKQKEKF
ncbi:MAG: hypothetical protein ACYCYR_10610 [Desulfobulbaceae bacterium]